MDADPMTKADQIPPPSDDDLSIDLAKRYLMLRGWLHSDALEMAISRRCHAAEAEVARLRNLVGYDKMTLNTILEEHHAEAGKLAEENARLRAEVDETNALLARSVRDNAAYEVIRKRDSQRIATLTAALSKINDVRNSIIGSQQVNWSEHVYPLVAALNAAGIEGMEYPAAKERFATTMEQIATLTAERDVARSNYEITRLAEAERLLQDLRPVLQTGAWGDMIAAFLARTTPKADVTINGLGVSSWADHADKTPNEELSAGAKEVAVEVEGYL